MKGIVLGTALLFLFPGLAPTEEAGVPGEFRIGIAVAPLTSWMTAWTLNDLFKIAGFEEEMGDTRASEMWIPEIHGQWLVEERHEVRTDELGWPISLTLEGGRQAHALNSVLFNGLEIPGAFPEGIYTLSYDGEGRIEVYGAQRLPDSRPGEWRLRYDGTAGVILSIRETDPRGTGDYLRNFQLLRPDAVDGERFNRTYLDYLEPFAVIRPLHFTGDQLTYGPRLPWEGRKPEEYSHWGGALGAPYEVAMDLANRSNSDLWLNVPIAADDHFVRRLGELALEELDPNRKLYLELGNELWNYASPYSIGREYALEEARRRWPDVEGRVHPYSDGDPVNEAMMIYSWQGARTSELAAIFREAWGDESDRLVVVLAGQIGGSTPFWHPSRYLLESPVYVGEEGASPAAESADAFAVAPYVGEWEEDITFSRESPEQFIEEAISYVRGEAPWGPDAPEPGLRYSIRSDRTLSAEFGLPLISYEGGQHFVGSRFTRDVVNPHPDMQKLYRALLEVWQDEGGGLFMHFSGIQPRGQSEPGVEPGYFESENFGVKELQTQEPEEAPKYRALLEVMTETGQIR